MAAHEVLNGTSWEIIAAAGGPEPRYSAAATWTSEGLLVYGGSSAVVPAMSSGSIFTQNGWRKADCGIEGCERGGAFALARTADGAMMFGGGPYGNAPSVVAFRQANMSWSPVAKPDGTPDFGNVNPSGLRLADAGDLVLALGQGLTVVAFDKAKTVWSRHDTTAPEGLCKDAALAWSGRELVAWGGLCGEPSSAGWSYQPAVRELE